MTMEPFKTGDLALCEFAEGARPYRILEVGECSERGFAINYKVPGSGTVIERSGNVPWAWLIEPPDQPGVPADWRDILKGKSRSRWAHYETARKAIIEAMNVRYTGPR